MAITHLGQDGYIRVQKETAYNTSTKTAMTFLPLTEGTIGFEQTKIEKANIINSRLPQLWENGRKAVTGELTFPMVPDLFGMFMNLFVGAETAVTGNGTTAPYTHVFLMPVTGLDAGVSWTAEQAIGSDLADDYTGVKMTKLVVKSDAEGFMTLTGTFVGVDRNDNDVARATTITISSKKFYSFCNGLVEITPASVSKYTQKVDGFELTLDMGYDEDGLRYKVGSCSPDTPIFGTIPKVSLKLDIDAERRYEDWAIDNKQFKVEITLTSAEIAVNSIPYSVAFELPAMILPSGTKRENGQDNLKMSLEFQHLGGTTTGSGAVAVPAEIRVADMTPTYTTYA